MNIELRNQTGGVAVTPPEPTPPLRQQGNASEGEPANRQAMTVAERPTTRRGNGMVSNPDF